MKNKPFSRMPMSRLLNSFSTAPALAIAAVVILTAATGCSPKTDTKAETTSVTASNVTLTATQRQNLQLYRVAP